MKLFIAAGLAIAAISLGNVATAGTPNVPVVEERASEGKESTMVTVIDGVAVPFDLQINIQMLYQGHAVTQVSIVDYNGEKAYRLRVDRDSIPDDYDSIYLYYDMEWRLIEEKDISRPKKPEPATESPKPVVSPEETPAAPTQPAPEPAAEEAVPSEAATGGRGGGIKPKPDNNGEANSEGNDSTDNSEQDEEATAEPEATEAEGTATGNETDSTSSGSED